jgi:hypothetical protein
MRPVETIPGMEGEGIKENDGGWWGEFNYDNIVRTFVNVTMYPQYNNNRRKIIINNILKLKKKSTMRYHDIPTRITIT